MQRMITATSVVAALLYTVTATQAASTQAGTATGVPTHQDRPEILMRVREASHQHGGGGGSNNLSYRGGTGGTGVETGGDKVYLVYWGSQWTNNDPSGEAAIQKKFFNNVGGSSWNESVTQYCQGVAVGTVACGTSGTHATNPTGVLAGVWYDNAKPAPTSPVQSQFAAEAATAAAQFGNTSASANSTVQYVINTATRNNISGFGTQFCAWHSSTSSNFGNIAYTNMPYITDAGSSCGANFVNSGSVGLTDGITIVGGHEFAETESDIFPSSGWIDSTGSENGDKCAWISSGQGASANVTLGTVTLPVQSLWSNAFNRGAGGCVQTY